MDSPDEELAIEPTSDLDHIEYETQRTNPEPPESIPNFLLQPHHTMIYQTLQNQILIIV